MSKLRDPRHRHDAFFRKARGAGFAARSVYKLEEIDRKLRLLHAGDRVLDLGCRPGSWLQYALKVVGPHGAVVGIDRDPLPQAIPGTRVLVGDMAEQGLLHSHKPQHATTGEQRPDLKLLERVLDGLQAL